jgi:hypothetical protein
MLMLLKDKMKLIRENRHLQRKLWVCERQLETISARYPDDGDQELARLALEALKMMDPPLSGN